MRMFRTTVVVYTEDEPTSYDQAVLEAKYQETGILGSWTVDVVEDVHEDPDFPQEYFD
jgi:hypothetical protein